MRSSLTRRDFLKYCGVGTAAAAAALALAACSSSDDSSSSSSDTSSSTSESSSSSSSSSSSDSASDSGSTSSASSSGYWPEDYLIDSINVVASSDGGTFYPGSGVRFGQIQTNIYQWMAVQGDSGEMLLVLLKSVEQVSDTDYDCELFDFIYDTNGVNMKASDIEYSCRRYIEVDGYTGSFNKLDYIEPTGDYTFTWHCTSAFDTGEMLKNFNGQPMFTQESFESTGDDEMVTQAIGTGPYKLSNYITGSQLTLVADESFWMKNITDEDWLKENFYSCDAQNVREIVIDIVSEASSRAIALEMGTAVAVDSLNILDAQAYMDDPSLGIEVIEIESRGPVGFYFNCSDNSVCSDVKLRQAICYLVDNDSYAEACSYPAVPATGFLQRMFDPIPEWNDPNNEYYNYDPDKARELIAESSYNGETLKFLYNSGGATALQDCAIMLQAALKDEGISVDLVPVDQSVMDSYKSDFTAFDIFFDTFSAGSSYVYSVLNRFWVEDSKTHMDGKQVIGINDDYLDELYVKVVEAGDDADDAIREYDQYFTYEKCYGYSILCYNTTAGGLDTYNVVVNSTGAIVPGAFSLK